jgi:kynurenine formamidase
MAGRDFVLIDLSQPLKLNVEVYPGDPKPQRTVFSEIKKTGWEHYIHQTGDHNFQPHADGPNHQNPEMSGRGVESWGKDYVFNQAGMIDLSDAEEAKMFGGISYLARVTKKHLQIYELMLQRLKAVIIRTGYDKLIEINRPHVPENLPYLEKEAADYINSFDNIRVVGIDSITVDPPGTHTAHQILKNKMIVESLVHLGDIPADKRNDFYLQTNLIKIEGATGGPVAATAWIAG